MVLRVLSTTLTHPIAARRAVLEARARARAGNAGDGTAIATPLRVLVVTDHVGGGTGRHLLSLLGAFDPTRVTVSLMTEGRVHTEGANAQVIRRIAPLGRLQRFPFAQLHTLWVLIGELRAAPVDVLHTYGLWPILYGRILKRLGLVPCLVENRECDGHNWNAHCYRALRTGRGLVDRVICVSHSVATQAEAKEGLLASRVLVIENGATRHAARYTHEEARRLLGVPPTAVVVGTVASDIDRPVKGIRTLVDAMPVIRREVPNAWFVLVGGPAPDSDVVRALQARGLLDQVVLPGFRDDVEDLYPAMDVLALPSLSEGLPVALLEAMLHGIPAVATNVGGIPEVVADGTTGFLVPVGSPEALAERIVALALSPARRYEMGRRGRERFEQLFDIARTARRYEALYADVVQGRRMASSRHR